MKSISGLALAAIGLIHCLVAFLMPGAIGFGGVWKEIVGAGIIDAVKAESLRIWGVYWFLMPGLLMIIFGLLCHWIENRLRHPLPSFAGWTLLAAASFGIILDLDTGFWLVLLIAVNMIVVSRRAKQADQQLVATNGSAPRL